MSNDDVLVVRQYVRECPRAARPEGDARIVQWRLDELLPEIPRHDSSAAR
jgi:hypothetical protein